MDMRDNRTAVVAVVTGAVMLLLGLCLGALVGGAGGVLIGRRLGDRDVQQLQVEPTVPSQRLPRLPELPAMPEFPGLTGGAVVGEVIEGSPAATAGIEVGDIILQVDDTPIDANHRLAAILGDYEPGDEVQLTVWRDGVRRTLDATLGASSRDASVPYLGVRYSDLPD